MKAIFILFFSLLLPLVSLAQSKCPDFIPDTLLIPKENKTVGGSYLQANLKKGACARFYKLANGKLYLKLIVTENLYFDKVDKLEIQSGGKSYYEKDARQMEVTKTSGCFVFEIFRNYVGTLKEEGITGIIFGKVKTSFTRSDASQIRQTANCFYESIEIKK